MGGKRVQHKVLVAAALLLLLMYLLLALRLSDTHHPQHGGNTGGGVLHRLRNLISATLRNTKQRQQRVEDVMYMYDHSNTSCQSCVYKNYDLQRPSVFNVSAAAAGGDYYRSEHGVRCLDEGTYSIDKSKTLVADANSSIPDSEYECRCMNGWYGPHCAYPHILQYTPMPFEMKNIHLRDKPRRIVYALPFNMEFDWMEVMLEEYRDVVDVFLVLESRYSNYGEEKHLRLLNALRSGVFAEHQHKIVYVYLNYFPSDGRTYGAKADNLPRMHLGTVGLKHQIIGTRPDDLFFIGDTDELPTKESLMFLKLHDGYPEPVGFHLQHRIFGFYWRNKHAPDTQTFGACSMMMMEQVYQYRADSLRWSEQYLFDHVIDVEDYKGSTGRDVSLWHLGSPYHPAGYHCSWCFKPEGIRIKLLSAQSGDPPRWGDYPEKTDLDYIQYLIQTGRWFNDQPFLTATRVLHANQLLPPRYMLDHLDKFRYLLENPYIHKS